MDLEDKPTDEFEEFEGSESFFGDVSKIRTVSTTLLAKKVSDLTVKEFIIISRLIQEKKTLGVYRNERLPEDVLDYFRKNRTGNAMSVALDMKIGVKKIQRIIQKLLNEGSLEEFTIESEYSVTKCYRLKQDGKDTKQ